MPEEKEAIVKRLAAALLDNRGERNKYTVIPQELTDQDKRLHVRRVLIVCPLDPEKQLDDKTRTQNTRLDTQAGKSRKTALER